MTNLKNTLCAVLALSFAAGTAVPLSAAPLPSPRLMEDMAAKNADVTALEVRGASLEDTYMALVRRAESGQARGGGTAHGTPGDIATPTQEAHA